MLMKLKIQNEDLNRAHEIKKLERGFESCS